MQASEIQNSVRITSRIITLTRGMYIIRYAATTTDSSGPQISLSPAPIGDGVVDFFPGEGVRNNVLSSAADCLIARVTSPAANIVVHEFHANGSTGQAQLRVDRIDTAQRTAPAPQAVPAPRLVGHVETLGDVAFAPPWLGKPDSRLRLEGFGIDVSFTPPGVVLDYSCRMQGTEQFLQGRSGEFIGSRGRAKSINAVSFALSGPHANNYELSGQVVFSDTPPLPLIPGKELAGPTGTEHLVALRLDLNPRQEKASAWQDHPSLEVFRKG